MFWCWILHFFGHLINHIVLFVTIESIFYMYPLISSSSGANCVTCIFLVPSALKTLNDLDSGFILIYFSFTNCLLIPVWMHLEPSNILSCSFFLSDIITTLSSLFLLSLLCEITYWFFRELLCTKVCCTMPTPNLQQNPLLCCYSLYHPTSFLVLLR